MKARDYFKVAAAFAVSIVLSTAVLKRYVWLPSYLRVALVTTLNIVLNAVTFGDFVLLEGRVRGGVFRNWAGRFRYRPQRILRPTTEEEILYHRFVDPRVEPDDLFDGEEEYVPRNRWNTSTEGRLAHFVQRSNTLFAAITLVAQATILRERDDGTPVTDRQELVVCGGLGEPFRNSDPQIAEIVNGAAGLGNDITLLDPAGLYLDGLLSAGMETLDDADAAEFWRVERGAPDHAVPASFAVPEERGYVVGDIKVDGLPITRGAQVADKVRIRIGAVVKPGDHQPARSRCVA